ncbi:hypothetical protein BDN70DRAFT_820819 [Pholiota conissans]|uniref:Uncharacterized protein n=1 Tax=Pholiota conissans TaxID=109636 RepID=A0A9P6CR62_9AGAR|nr:hypothetical protein BDN70DRAFT_820819 [Pholiota conissans]
MATWAPDLYKYYVDHMRPLYEHDTTLIPIFPSCIFSAATYNFGPQTVTYPHRDFSNLTFGWCAVSALGSFDHRTGGHLVLWECRLVIQFPPGSLILLPSSIITHSNVRIAPHERRYSFTTYTAGALFRWVSNDFMKADDYYETLNAEQLKIENHNNVTRWTEGLALLPKLALDTSMIDHPNVVE